MPVPAAAGGQARPIPPAEVVGALLGQGTPDGDETGGGGIPVAVWAGIAAAVLLLILVATLLLRRRARPVSDS